MKRSIIDKTYCNISKSKLLKKWFFFNYSLRLKEALNNEKLLKMENFRIFYLIRSFFLSKTFRILRKNYNFLKVRNANNIDHQININQVRKRII